MSDADTNAWIRNASDEKAVADGCTFNVLRGARVVWWVERYCRLYEGEQAGERVTLHGCHQCGTVPSEEEFWKDNPTSHAEAIERAARFIECIRAGHRVDWQYDVTMRLFGWVKWSDRWGRLVRRFRQASIWLPKKQKKSPTLAAWGMYLTCGDSEPGQKVFLAAKDGGQARKIAGEHAAQMLRLSPDLSATCTLNKSVYRITHHETASYLEPLSSGNARHQEAKEGLNGCILIDETHVVDRELMNRISRAGISRSEPLQIEVSTAGNNPDSYGRERFEYASEVAEGKRYDEQLLSVIFAAPQTLSEEDLAADPLRWGRLANPSMGHTIDPAEYLRDYETSKAKGILHFLDFLMYRLNIWQQVSNPWIRASDWERCRRDFTAADLIGRRCVAGLDLSRTHDMSALVLVFEGDGGGYYLWPYFWLPEDRAREIDHRVPVMTWARSGHLELIPGGVVLFGHIGARFAEVYATFAPSELTYDPRFAEEPTQHMSDGVTDAEGNVLIAGTGVLRVPFAQTDANFAVPTDDFEKLVLAGKLWHNGHPVMTWQVAQATVTVRPFTKVKRVKKPNDPLKSVDGVIAGIMGLGRIMLAPARYDPSMLYG